MPLEEKKYDVEANNDWAKNVKGVHLYIDSAQSGRKGYFCIGCDKQMDAVIRKKNPSHRSYFRHVPVDVSKDQTPCTFSNREYRETLATDILQRIKSIKVPSVHKYPPKGKDGIPMLLEKAKFITAHKVKSQLTFYEDSEGAVLFGKNPDVEDRYLLIRPDVIFFDAKGRPILLIELVITHKVKEEKKIKLRRLGIDTISIIVPKSSEQEIEDNFKTTKRVKWEYNEIEANTNYIRVSSGPSEGVLEFDADQRRIFEESISCRKSRLNNTLRVIKKSLQSEPYRRVEQHFESEISRIEDATKKERQELEDLERIHSAEVFSNFAGEYNQFEREENKFQGEFNNLEGRYKSKEREVRESQGREDKLIQKYYDSGSLGKEIKERYRIKEAGIGKDIEYQQQRGEEFKLEEGRISDSFRQLEERAEKDFEEELEFSEGRRSDVGQQIDGFNEYAEREIRLVSKKHEDLKAREQRVFESVRDRIERDRRAIQSKIDSFDEFTNQEEGRLEDEFEKLRKEFTNKIDKRDSSGESELSKRIETVLNVGRISSNYNERLKVYEGYKAYLELARGRAWEK